MAKAATDAYAMRRAEPPMINRRIRLLSLASQRARSMGTLASSQVRTALLEFCSRTVRIGIRSPRVRYAVSLMNSLLSLTRTLTKGFRRGATSNASS